MGYPRAFHTVHYPTMAIIKTVTYKLDGWETARDRTKTGKMWATPGQYLRASMVKRLALSIGDVEIAEELTQGHEIT